MFVEQQVKNFNKQGIKEYLDSSFPTKPVKSANKQMVKRKTLSCLKDGFMSKYDMDAQKNSMTLSNTTVNFRSADKNHSNIHKGVNTPIFKTNDCLYLL